jgi:hypothetical protein
MALPLTHSPAVIPPYKRWYSSRLLKRIAIILSLFFFLYYFNLFDAGIQGPSSILLDRVRTQSILSKPVEIDDEVAQFTNHNRSARPRAAFVSLVRERNLADLLPSLRDIQWAFNDDLEHGYDFVSPFFIQAFLYGSPLTYANIDLPL